MEEEAVSGVVAALGLLPIVPAVQASSSRSTILSLTASAAKTSISSRGSLSSVSSPPSMAPTAMGSAPRGESGVTAPLNPPVLWTGEKDAEAEAEDVGVSGRSNQPSSSVGISASCTPIFDFGPQEVPLSGRNSTNQAPSSAKIFGTASRATLVEARVTTECLPMLSLVWVASVKTTKRRPLGSKGPSLMVCSPGHFISFVIGECWQPSTSTRATHSSERWSHTCTKSFGFRVRVAYSS